MFAVALSLTTAFADQTTEVDDKTQEQQAVEVEAANETTISETIVETVNEPVNDSETEPVSETTNEPSNYPRLTLNTLDYFNTSLAPKTSSAPKYQFFKSVEVEKPYKFMDDITFVGLPIFGAGWLINSQKTYFRQNHTDKDPLRVYDRLLTDFHSEFDNYTQFAPMVLATGLKLGGVDGRSDWGRYLASSLMAYGLMAAIVNPIKYSAKEMRPDGSTANSFPSGHTATAFASATILHKEYGLTHSPWYSIGGYAIATATGVMRVLNNRHWVSDVLAGAGIGIMSTELAYGLSDLIFKGKGLRRTDKEGVAHISDRPSFFSISMGVGVGNHDLTLNEKDEEDDGVYRLRFRHSTVVAAEGAYFFNRYIGVGARLKVSSTPVAGFGDFLDAANEFSAITKDSLSDILDDCQIDFTIESDHITEFSCSGGIYLNLPISKRLALGTKFLIGRSILDDIDISAEAKYLESVTENENMQDGYKWNVINVSGNSTMTYGTGISLTYAYKPNYTWRVFIDYDYCRKHFTCTSNDLEFLLDIYKDLKPELYRELQEICKPTILESKKHMNRFTFGGSFCISF